MPQEFLRDVLRSGDAAGRRQRHWSVLPLSIAGHGAIVMALLFSPWATGVELPVVASPLEHFIATVAPTPPPPPSPPTNVPRRDVGAPTTAPDTIAREADVSDREPVVGGIPDGPGVDSAHPLVTDLGTTGPATVAPPPPPVPVPKIVRVGGVIREPRKLVHVAPVYPEIARVSRVQGIVTYGGRSRRDRQGRERPRAQFATAARRGGRPRRAPMAVYADRAQWSTRARPDDDHRPLLARPMTSAASLSFILSLAVLLTAPYGRQGTDDPRLRAAVERFFAMQQAEDVAGYLSLWSTKVERPTAAQLKYVFESGDDTFSEITVIRRVSCRRSGPRSSVCDSRSCDAGAHSGSPAVHLALDDDVGSALRQRGRRLEARSRRLGGR